MVSEILRYKQKSLPSTLYNRIKNTVSGEEHIVLWCPRNHCSIDESKLMENNIQEEKEILCLKSEGNQSSQAISTVHVVLMDTAIISAF